MRRIYYGMSVMSVVYIMLFLFMALIDAVIYARVMLIRCMSASALRKIVYAR